MEKLTMVKMSNQLYNLTIKEMLQYITENNTIVGVHMSNEKTQLDIKATKRNEQKIAKIIKLLQSATLDQLDDIEVFVKTDLT
jgi:hypothetical protein